MSCVSRGSVLKGEALIGSCWLLCCCVGGPVGSRPRAETTSSTTTPSTPSGRDPQGKRREAWPPGIQMARVKVKIVQQLDGYFVVVIVIVIVVVVVVVL